MSMSQVATDEATVAEVLRIVVNAVLHDLHNEINAIGGVPANEYDRGANDAVGKALTIIEAKQARVAK